MSLFLPRLLTLALSTVALVPLAANAQTQASMTQDACAQYKKTDQELNATRKFSKTTRKTHSSGQS